MTYHLISSAPAVTVPAGWLQQETNVYQWQLQIPRTCRVSPSTQVPYGTYIELFEYQVPCGTYIELCVKDNQFGAGRNEVVTLVSLHELGKHQVLILIWNTEQINLHGSRNT